jgi:hypothetical protein
MESNENGLPAEPTTRRPYTPPRLERLGEWSALTLHQSIPIFND